MKKAQIQGQIFLYLLGLFIVSFILLYGYNAMRTFKEKAEQVEFIQFQTNIFSSIKTISSDYGSVKKECLKITYRDGDNLFVTVDRLNRVQKFSSEDGSVPKLSKLGTTEWERAKEKTKESLKKVAAELIQIYAGRKAQSGYSFSEDNHWQKELEASFEYEETPDQHEAIFAVKKDMEKV